MASAPAFYLARAARKTGGGYEYLGRLVLPDGSIYVIEANAIRSESGKGHFEGIALLEKAAPTDQQPELELKRPEMFPFNDSLEGV